MDYTKLPDIENIKQQVLYKIWEIINDKYALYIEKKIDWDYILLQYKRYLDEIDSYHTLYQLIDQILLELKDPHTRIVFSPHSNSLGVMSMLLIFINGNYYVYKYLGGQALKTGMLLLSINEILIKDEAEILRNINFIQKVLK